MALIKQGKGRTITRYSNLFNIGNKLFQTVQFFRQLQFTKKKLLRLAVKPKKKNFLSHTMLKARYSDDAEPEYSSNNIHLSLVLQKFETSLRQSRRAFHGKKNRLAANVSSLADYSSIILCFF